MSFVKFASILSITTFSTAAFAEDPKTSKFDILGSLNYGSNSVGDAKVSTYELSGSFLYSLTDNEKTNPLLGGGLSFLDLSVKMPYVKELSLITLLFNGYIGLKFKTSEKFSIYTLLNIGYPIYIQNNNQNFTTTKKTFYRGSFVWTYHVSQEFSLGLGALLSYNNFSYQSSNSSASQSVIQISPTLNVGYHF
ncbi:hypothetical protein [Spirobacillus cienkowskii]|uniref:hypothetical protein n=1 Tax=Spirobacillus cienkowskii TaxID=495820 RepID=UPI0030CC7CE8